MNSMNSITKTLQNIIGKDNVLTALEDRISYSYDATNRKYLPDIIAIAHTRDEIKYIIEVARHFKIPLIARGAGSGITGGTLAVKGGIILNLEEMKKITLPSKDEMIILAEPGVITLELQEEAAKYGYFYPPDPGSQKISTIGGNVAEGAGGMRAVKYGVTRDYILGLEVITGTGELIKTGYFNEGIELIPLTDLFIASEGTLGVITNIALKLLPSIEHTITCWALFTSLEDAAKAVEILLHTYPLPTVLELLDGEVLKIGKAIINAEWGFEPEAALLIEVDGTQKEVTFLQEQIVNICKNNKAKTIQTAQDEITREKLWRMRRSISPALGRIAPMKVNEDICIPRGKIVYTIKAIKKLAKDVGLNVYVFGHAGDGNLHINFMTHYTNKEEIKLIHQVVEKIFKLTLELGGTLSGEHGIGLNKAEFMSWQFNSDELDIFNGLKKIFDPDNILNPYKMGLS